ncbi:MAG TPA: hypothetical protein VFZ65_01995 [Planctomycetota bacterium]|nr:hypothetical protein [Planctomycetota bacterium]
MNARTRGCMLVAMLGVGPASAQCPNERTQAVPADLEIGAAQDCGGFQYRIAGVQVNSSDGGCPVFVIYTPPHEIAVASSEGTKVEPTGAPSPITMASFKCQTNWFLFVPIGSSCVLDRVVNLGFVPHLHTVPCTGSES